MERFKTFYEKRKVRRKKDYRRTSDIDNAALREEFKEWVSSKLQRPIREFVGAGAEGLVYEIDKFRVIKFVCAGDGTGWEVLSRLKDKGLPGIVKVYSMGVVHLPVKFHFDETSQTGISKFGSCEDNLVGYIIMEKVKTDGDLSYAISILNSHWYDFYYHVSSYRKKNIGNLSNDLTTTINRGNDLALKEYGEYLQQLNGVPKNIAKILEDIIKVIRILQGAGINPSDFINPGNWGYNKKGELVLFDFWDNYARFNAPKPKHEVL